MASACQVSPLLKVAPLRSRRSETAGWSIRRPVRLLSVIPHPSGRQFHAGYVPLVLPCSPRGRGRSSSRSRITGESETLQYLECWGPPRLRFLRRIPGELRRRGARRPPAMGSPTTQMSSVKESSLRGHTLVRISLPRAHTGLWAPVGVLENHLLQLGSAALWGRM